MVLAALLFEMSVQKLHERVVFLHGKLPVVPAAEPGIKMQEVGERLYELVSLPF
jgi:hypothetical protein